MADAGGRTNPDGGTFRFLIFRAERRIYALAADVVAEVIRVPRSARLPHAPPALRGVANLRGAVLPLASLRILLGLPDGEDDSARAIVLAQDSPVAIVVDAVEDFVTVESQHVQSEGADLSLERGEKASGAFPLGEGRGVAKIIDVKALLADAFELHARPKTEGRQRQRGLAPAANAKAIAERERFLVFDLGGQEFGLELAAVQEVVDRPEAITAAPGAESLVAGMIAFRDRLLPLLSLRGLLGFEPAPFEEGQIVVASLRGASVGLIVDHARAVISADPALIDPAPSALVARAGGESKIKSVYRGAEGQRLVPILSPDHLFRGDVMDRLGANPGPARPDAPAKRGTHERKFLVFRLNDGEFGLPIEAVEEVARVPAQITKVPKTPKFLEGVVNLRGEVIPVVDQRRRFEMPRREESEREGLRLIVVRTKEHRAGLIVDSVSEVLGVNADAIEAPPELTDDITKLVHGVVNLETAGRIILLLDPAELLTRAERGMLDAFERRAQQP
jgi:purine-binding chemotaxis protein CheW